MTIYTLRGVDVDFPYDEAYQCQLTYMEKVIEALQEVTMLILCLDRRRY
jgi:regulator of telomere elongation helicase 1